MLLSRDNSQIFPGSWHSITYKKLIVEKVSKGQKGSCVNFIDFIVIVDTKSHFRKDLFCDRIRSSKSKKCDSLIDQIQT